jgi:hypothetical protein
MSRMPRPSLELHNARDAQEMMVPKPSIEQGREIDCYLDCRPVVSTVRKDSPAIDHVEETKDGNP